MYVNTLCEYILLRICKCTEVNVVMDVFEYLFVYSTPPILDINSYASSSVSLRLYADSVGDGFLLVWGCGMDMVGFCCRCQSVDSSSFWWLRHLPPFNAGTHS